MSTNIQVTAERAKNYHLLSADIEIDDAGQRITAIVARAKGTLIYTFNRSLRLVRVARQDGVVVQAVKGVSFVRGLVRRELYERGLTGMESGTDANADGEEHASADHAGAEHGPSAPPASGKLLQFPAISTPRRLRIDLRNAFTLLDNATTDDERTAARTLVDSIKAEILARQSVTAPALIAVDKQHDRMIRNVGRNMHDAASLSAERGAKDDYPTKRQRGRLVRSKIRGFYQDMDERFPDPPARSIEVTEALLREIALTVKNTVSPMLGNWTIVKGDVAIVACAMKINRAALRSILRTYAVNLSEMLGVGSLKVSECRITLIR